ncbi:MAG: 50S ribosomal protein L22 [Chthonomonas sp.]|nr:50S ribosomal protein L22 [Chthonomonas sp.]
MQPRKVRIVADMVNGKTAEFAAAKLRFHPSKGAGALRKVLVSAMANAAENNGISSGALRIRSISIDEGPRIKRFTQKAMGRGAAILKKTSHITVVLEDFEPKADQKPHGTKAKARPKFDVAKKTKAAPKKEEEVAVAETEAAAEAPAEVEAAVEAGATEETTEVTEETKTEEVEG